MIASGILFFLVHSARYRIIYIIYMGQNRTFFPFFM